MASPGVDRIPKNVLLGIFIECLPTDRLKIGLSPTEAPIVLTHVCRKWRRTAIENPALWEWIRLSLSDKKFNHTVLGSMCHLLERVKAGRLNLQILHHGLSEAHRAIGSPNIMAMLVLPLASSLTRLTLIRVPIKHIEVGSPATFPRLERLVLEMGQNHEWEEWGVPLVSFQHSPSLRYLAISPWALDGNNKLNIILPHLSQLTHIVLGLGFCDDGATYFFTHILPHCTQLQCLRIPLCDDDLQILDFSASAPHRMENLQTLILNYYHGLAGYPAFFDQFTFPNLTSLRIQAEELDFSAGHWTPHSTQRFLAKLSTFQRLDRLSIQSDMGMNLSSFTRLFKAVRNITTLELSVPMNYEGYEELFGELNVLYPDSRNLVKLRTLVLEFQPHARLQNPANDEPLDAILFTEFVRHRLVLKPPANRLKKVVLIADQETMDELDVLVRAGEFDGIPETGFSVQRIITKNEEDEDGEEEEDAYSEKERCNLWVGREPLLQNWMEITAVL